MKLCIILAFGLVAVTSSTNATKVIKASTNCFCGWTNKGRIVGGRETKKNEFPLVASIALVDDDDVQAFCGATILTPYHALTAAHCTQKEILELLPYVKLLVGAHNVKQAASSSQIVAVEKMIPHENYSPTTNGITNPNDISLLIMAEKINFNGNVGPACMPTEPLNIEDQYIKVLGWGRTDNGESSDVLREVNLKVIPFSKCRKVWPLNTKQSQLCTFGKDRDSCKGDSGGPLIWLDPETNKYTLVALVSYGSTTCGIRPAVNTDVSRYLDWIQTKISESGKPGTTCQKVDTGRIL